MAHVHYKFSSKLSYDMVVFDGPHTTLSELKRQIMGKEKLRAADCDLQITNAQTKQEYTADDDVIPKGSSVIVRRIPIIGARPSSNKKANNIQRSDVQLPHAFGASRAMDEQKSTSTLSFFSKMANLADADVPEEDKLKVLMSQSVCDSMNLSKKFGSLPGSYTCYRCGLSGHHIRNCPTIGQDKNAEAPLKIKKSTGIPRSFMVEVDDPSIKGAMLTNCGRYAIPAIDAEAYAIGKKEKPPFFVQELQREEDPIPDELLCVICRDLLCDSVVIPCCGNSYCDDCIRTTLLDSEDHVCPTCNQSDVSPDTLIANKFLRQAVNNFKKERGYGNKKQPAATQSQNLNPTPKPAPTPPLPAGQSLLQKPQHSRSRQQDPLQVYPKPAKTPPLSQVPVAPPTATCPASVDSMPSVSSELVHNNQEMSAKDNSPYSSVSSNDPTIATSQLKMLGNDISMAEQPPSVNQQASSEHSKSSSSLNSSTSSAGCTTGSWNETTKQHPTPPSPFSPSIFHMNLPTHQSNGCYPPGYPPNTPIWTPAALQGSSIPSLCSPTPSVPMEWYRHQRKESSPHRASSSRRSSTHSKAKSKSSQYYSHSSSHSESRSRSRSKGRSRHTSPYSRRRDHHSRSRPSSSYTFGYKRSHSPTPSSSSSPRGVYQSKSKSPTNRRSRHHSKRSSSSIRRRGERCRMDAAGTNQQAEQRIQSSSLELDRERYLQWKKEYTEWCEKYFSSYVNHFHQLPFPPLLGLPPACPQWEDKEGMMNHSQTSCSNYKIQGRRASRRDGRSPSSDSSSYSRSPPSHSSSESHSTPSQSPSRSSPSHKESHCCSPPSQSSSDGLSAQSEDRNETGSNESCTNNNSRLPVTQTETAGAQQPALRNGEESDLLKQEQRNVKTQALEKREGSPSPHTADSEDESQNKKKIKIEIPASDHEVSNASDAFESVQHLLEHHETKDKEEKNLEKEKANKKDRDSHSGRVEGGPHKVKPRKEPNLVDPYRKESSESSRGHDSRSAWNRKRRTDFQRNDRERSPAAKHQSSKYHQTKTAQHPESRKSDSPKPLEVKKLKKENNTGHRTKADIWEGGIKVKPQKKINININLDVKRKDENIDQQDLTNVESIEEKTPENTERVFVKEETINKSQADTEANGTKKAIKEEEVEVAQMWDQTCFTDADKVMLDETKVGNEPEQDFTLWHCALSGAEEMDRATEAVTEGQGQEVEESATTSQKEEENPCKKNGGETMTEKRNMCGEEDLNILTPQTSKDQIHAERLTTADDNVNTTVSRCGAEESDERRTVKDLEENPPGRAADGRNEQLVTQSQVFRSKWQREEKEGQNEGEVGVHTNTPPVALSQPSVTVTIGETEGGDGPHRQRSTEMEREPYRVMVMEKDQEAQRNAKASASNRGVVPSSGKEQASSVLYSHRDSGGDRKQDEERKNSKEHKKEKEKVRSRDREWERSSVSPAKRGKISSHSSTSHERERESSYRSSSGTTSRRSSAGRRSTDLPDQNPKKSFRDSSPSRKSSHQDPSRTYRRQSKSVGSHHSSPSTSNRHSKDRDLLPPESSAESPTWGWVQSKSRNESERDQKERELDQVNKTKTCSKSGRDHREGADQERVRRREEEVFFKRYGESKLGRR